MKIAIKDLWKLIAILMVAGLVLMGIGLKLGVGSVYIDGSGLHAASNDTPIQITEPDLGAIQDIDVAVGYFDVEFKTGERFGLDVTQRGNEPQVQWSVENGRLRIWQETRAISINLGLFNNQPSLVTVYVPAGAELNTLNLAVSSGNISLGDLRAAALHLQDSYGDVSISNLQGGDIQLGLSSGNLIGRMISADSIRYTNNYGDGTWEDISAGSLSAHVSSGDFILRGGSLDSLAVENSYGDISAAGLRTGGVDIKSSSGDTSLSGDLLGKTQIDASYGQVKLALAGQKAQYSYDISTKYGQIIFDGASIGDHANIQSGNAAANNLKINCSSGDIEVSFDRR